MKCSICGQSHETAGCPIPVTTDDKRPREYWIYGKHTHTWVEDNQLPFRAIWSMEMRVIEYAAFDQVKRENVILDDGIRAALKTAQIYHDERNQLRAELESWKREFAAAVPNAIYQAAFDRICGEHKNRT